MLLRFERLVTMNSFFNYLLIEISVHTSSTLMFRRVLDAAPINLFVACFLSHKHVAVVFKLSFSLLTQNVFYSCT